MATPSSPAARSNTEPRSSPAPQLDKSFAASANANLTEDEDDGLDHASTFVHAKDASFMADSPHAQRKPKSGGGSRKSRGGRDSTARASSGPGGPPLFKDPSAIGKIRHLKKEDGEPLWRFDIQYDFLRAIFDDPRPVFTNSYDSTLPKQCFADLYIDTMARSSKTSKILHDKLLSDREAAKNMAMVCLLVNIGRMNTTLNFFPEMRAQLRTYHAIPSLQVDEGTTDYKQLQDAPRLKSILKGGTEDRPEPRSLDDLKSMDNPRTNPVNLLFLICNNASKVAELHFPPGHEFHDLIMKNNLSSKSRANAFLWIVWFYLESDFTEEGCEENPFGAGVDYGVDVANQGVPQMLELTPEEIKLENVDTPGEREFGLQRKAFRAKILNNEAFPDVAGFKRSARPSRPSGAASQSGSVAREVAAAAAAAAKESAEPATDTERSAAPNILPRIRPSKHESDMESVRSTPPPRSTGRALGPGALGTGASSASRRAGPYKSQLADGASPARQPPLLQQLYQQQQLQQSRKKKKAQKGERGLDDDDDDDRGNISVAPSRKPRPPTAHQIAVENNRKQRIEYLLSRGMHRKQHRARKARRTEGAIIRAQRRLDAVPDPFEDSEGEDSLLFNRNLFNPHPGAPQNMPSGTAFRERGFFGLVQLSDEIEDYGEEFDIYATAMRRACRRINRWEKDPNYAVVPTIKRQRVNVPLEDEYRDPNETEEEEDMDKMDVDLTMSILETTPAPPTKKRRPAGAGAGAGSSASRARGGRAAKPGAPGAGGVSSSTIRRRAAAAAKAAAAAAAAEAEEEANGDVTMDDAEDGENDVDATALVSGGEDNDGGADETDAAGSVAAKPRVTIKKAGPRAAPLSQTTRVKREYDDDDDDEGDGRGDADDDNDDELNDMDKTLLGMGDGDTDSE